jgi:hypothetical protein
VSIAVAVFAILSSAVTVIGGQAGLLWWAYKRGEEAGERRAGQVENTAKIHALEQQLASTRAELASILPTPPRLGWKSVRKTVGEGFLVS